MEGIRGSISPSTISPIEVLGIHAEDAVERDRYAETWARMMREDVARILAFQHAYDEAGRRLFPGEQLIDPNRLPQNNPKSWISARKTGCCSSRVLIVPLRQPARSLAESCR